jgi:hypothetical protein
MLFKSKKYPFGKYQVLFLTAKSWKSYFNFKKSIGFWNHPSIPIGTYADWSLRLMFIEIKKWLPEDNNFFSNQNN